MAYHYLTIGKTKPEIAEFDLVLAGEDDPKAVGQANKAAMAALGLGAVPPRKKAL